MAGGPRARAGDATSAVEQVVASHESRWATNEDWDNHRDEITTLYKDGNKTLKGVAQYMQEAHQFHATCVPS